MVYDMQKHIEIISSNAFFSFFNIIGPVFQLYVWHFSFNISIHTKTPKKQNI